VSACDPQSDGFEFRFRPPATPEQLHAVEASLGAPLPAELRSLLEESDGIIDSDDGGCEWVWRAERIAAINTRLRAADGPPCMPLDALLFFAGAGPGSVTGARLWPWPVIPKPSDDDDALYALAILDGRAGGVFMWRPWDDSRLCVARSFGEWVDRCLAAADEPRGAWEDYL
jgi:hypothetical protein